jgi:hypothetical protein
VALLAVLPGALCVWGFERISGRWVIGLSDRLLRFFGISAMFHALAAPATYRIWHDYLRSGALKEGELFPPWLWGVLLLYVIVPLAVGSALAVAVSKGYAWTRAAVGSDPAPTAWDFVFSDDRSAWIRLKLKSGSWVGGAYADGSYSGGYPEPADLYLSVTAEVDSDTGEFARGPDGNAILKDYGLLVRWEEVEFLEFAAREGAGT